MGRVRRPACTISLADKGQENRVQPRKVAFVLLRSGFFISVMKKNIIVFLALIIIFFFDACSFSQTRKLRIISLAPSTTEILFALGLDDEILGVSLFCNYPEKARTKDKVGTFSQPQIEKIIFLKPDLIFCTGLEQAVTVEQLRKLGLKVYVSDPSNTKELFASIREIGMLTGRNEEAEGLIKNMQSGIEEINLKTKLIPQGSKPKVFIEIWHDPLISAGKGSYIDELIMLAGGINIAHETIRPYSYFSLEQVIKSNPDCIILAYMDKSLPLSSLKKRQGFEKISAVKNNRFYNDINADLLLRPGPRLVEGLKEIYKRLYP